MYVYMFLYVSTKTFSGFQHDFVWWISVIQVTFDAIKRATAELQDVAWRISDMKCREKENMGKIYLSHLQCFICYIMLLFLGCYVLCCSFFGCYIILFEHCLFMISSNIFFGECYMFLSCWGLEKHQPFCHSHPQKDAFSSNQSRLRALGETLLPFC